jgi:hypothetical protein
MSSFPRRTGGRRSWPRLRTWWRSLALVLAVLMILGVMEFRYRSDLAIRLKATEFGLWAGYSDTFSACTAPAIDAARGRIKPNGTLGLMKADQDVTFWWFDGTGNIVHEATFHLNNVGLISRNNYDPSPKPREFRIVVLGDEMTAATTAAVQWPDLLEDELNSDPAVRAQLGTVRVFNFGHPDASVAQMATFWENKARRFRPDIVVVNSVYHSFDRMAENFCDTPTIRSDQSDGYRVVSYKAPGGEDAWMIISCRDGSRRLRDPGCDAGRPFALWMSANLAHNRQELAALQHQIRDDYVHGVLWNDRRPLWVLSLLGQVINPLEARIQQATVQAPDERGMQQRTGDERVAFVRSHLHRIADTHPEVLVIQNPYYPDVVAPPSPFPLSRRLAELDPRMAPFDMRKILPILDSPDEVQSWWQVPVASEKWSSRGHQMYARAVKVAIVNYLTQRGRLTGLTGSTVTLPP